MAEIADQVWRIEFTLWQPVCSAGNSMAWLFASSPSFVLGFRL